MKKLVLGLLAALLVSAGLVATTGAAPAQAVCGNPQYPACFSTATKVTAKKLNRTRVAITAQVRTVGSTARPVGTVKITIRRAGGTKNVFVIRTETSGGTVRITRNFRRTGKFTVSAVYVAKRDTVFQGSSGSTAVRIKRL